MSWLTAETPGPKRKATKRRFVLKPPVVLEHPLHKQMADVLRLEIGPPGKASKFGVVWWSIDHANYAGEVPGVRIGRGIVPGIPDLYLLHRGLAYHPEIKTDDGVLSDAQKSVMTAILACQGRVAVVRTSDELLDCLDVWAIPRARRIMP